MPIYTGQFTLAQGVRVRIIPPETQPQNVCIHNHEHSQNSTIYVGNNTVTTTTGIHTRAGETSSITIGPGDELWAISDTSDVEMHVLRVTQD